MIVRVTCPRCGDLAVPIDRIRVRRDQQAGNSFRFDCESCGDTVNKRAVGRVADMLLAAGAEDERELRPLSMDDVVELLADMESDDWLQRLLA